MNPPDDLRAIFFYGELEHNWIGHQMVDIYHDRIYNQFLPLIKEGTLAIDIGANVGLVSMFLSHAFERVISLEPSWEHFDALNRNLQVNKITNVKPLKKALYIKNGEFPFGGPTNNKTMRSLHMGTWVDGKSSEMVETITFDKLFEDEKIERVNLLKLDMEGTETEIFSSEGFQKVADKIDTIIYETHKWSGRHPNQIKDALKTNGFEVNGFPHDPEIFVARRKI